jgi:hypothetical protein
MRESQGQGPQFEEILECLSCLLTVLWGVDAAMSGHSSKHSTPGHQASSSL